jgi:DnaJ family protein C protein 3
LHLENTLTFPLHSRVTHLTPPSTSHLLRIAQLSYFLLPPSTQAQSTLKQCLYFDPDSKPCAKLHRQLKAFDKSFTKLDKLKEANDWRGVISLVDTTKPNANSPGLLTQFDIAFSETSTQLELPAHIQPFKNSERRRILVHALCRAYTRTDQAKRGERYCEELLSFAGSESDVDGLVGKGEALMAQEMWEEAVRVLEKAWDATGRGDHDVMQKLQKAQRLLKQSRQKDYYKVLGVARDADEKTIKKA